MSARPVVRWRRSRAAALAIVAATFLAACGGAGSSAPPIGSDAANSGVDASTFLVGFKVEEQGQPRFIFSGTAFAIGDRLLATNSHVTQGVLTAARDLATGGVRLTGVSAFQAETGKEFPLLEAIVHPAYTDTRSPDVGLFVTRDPLPSRLTLATPEEAGTVRKGDSAQVNGFPGDVFDQLFSSGFQPGLSVAQTSLFTGNIQALRNFDNRVVVDPPDEKIVDVLEYGMDTSPGTSGSPVLRNDKVIAVHNAGVVNVVLRPGQNQDDPPRPDREILATASFGIQVKHLHNLIKEYESGVLAAERRFNLPPSDALIAAGGGGRAGAGGVAGSTFNGAVANPANALVAHQLQIAVDQNLALTGTSSWPADPARNLSARQFTLSGTVDTAGKVEFRDNTPELVPGFRRGVYIGTVNPASGVVSGQYYELNEATNELIFFGNWTATR